jgi:hypothetical protein
LYLGGNFKTGVAFGDCVQFGADIAKQAGSFLTSSSGDSDSKVSKQKLSEVNV